MDVSASDLAPSLVDAALAYAARGWFVLPTHDLSSGACSCKDAACPSPGKHPRLREGVHDASTDPEKIRAWWSRWPNANIAIDCGRSNLTVADVDVKKGARGDATMRWYLDRPDARFNETYLVGTPSGGYHFYFAGATNTGRKQPLGPGIDVQSVGRYVLVPPSPGYNVLRPAPLAPFPTHLLPAARVDDGTIAFGEQRQWNEPEREQIPYGEHRQALLWLGWHLRSVQGLSSEAALPLMRAFVATLEGYDPARPFTDRDLRGMLTNVKPQVAQQPPPGPAAALDPIVPAHEVVATAPPPRQIVVPGLLVRGELHIYYGADGVGKTSLIAYLLALITRQGRDVLVFIEEDQPRDFIIKCWYAGADLSRVHVYSAGRSMREFLLPKCKVDLEAMLQNRSWGCIYFDSVNDYKSTDTRLNAADEARQLYGPLSRLAQAYDTTILCTAHTNARDVLEGARQIRAKARVVARVERPNFEPQISDEGIVFGPMQYDPLWTAVVTTEKFSRGKPGAVHAFKFEERASMDPYTQAYDYEIQPDGSRTVKGQYVCTGHELMPDITPTKMPRQTVKTDIEAQIYDLVRECPGFTNNDIARQVGGDRNKVFALIKKAREELGK